MQLRPLAATLCFAGLLGLTAAAQSMQVPAPPQRRPIVITNATVHPVTSETLAAPSYVVFDGGRIVDLGRGEPPTHENARIIDATGLHIYPGLIASETTLGLTEVGSVRETQDSREIGDFTPEVRTAVAVNPDTDLIPVARASGILLAATFPSGGIVSGRSSIIRLDGWTWEDMAVDDSAGLVINWPRTEPVFSGWGPRVSEQEQRRRTRENLSRIDDFFEDARRYHAARTHDDTISTDLRFEAMPPFLSGEKPLIIRADSVGQIESAVAWAERHGMKVIILGGRQADEAVHILAKAEVPVIISGLHRLPSRRHDDYDAVYSVPRRLYEGGVLFSIASGAETPHERQLGHVVATAAAYGLPPQEALKAATINAATILGIDGDYGSLEVGKSATLIVTTGDPLEIVTDTLMAFIDGRDLDLTSRHTRLFDKYREKYRQLGLID